MMWHYFGRGQLERCVETCDLGIELAHQLGSAPVQYGSIKTLALTELGRYDLVDGALAQEVTDDAHPFGQANQALARAMYLAAIEAWEPAAAAALDAMERAASLSRIWMQLALHTTAVTLDARAGEAVRAMTQPIEAIAERTGLKMSPIARAEAELAAGDSEAARTGSSARSGSSSTPTSRSRRGGALSASRARWWTWATGMGCWQRPNAGSSSPRNRASSRACGSCAAAAPHALDQLGRAADAAEQRGRARDEFDTLAARIADPMLHGWFVRQPLATRWLGER